MISVQLSTPFPPAVKKVRGKEKTWNASVVKSYTKGNGIQTTVETQVNTPARLGVAY